MKIREILSLRIESKIKIQERKYFWSEAPALRRHDVRVRLTFLLIPVSQDTSNDSFCN